MSLWRLVPSSSCNVRWWGGLGFKRGALREPLLGIHALLVLLSVGIVLAHEPQPPETKGFQGSIFVPKDTRAYDRAHNVTKAYGPCNDYWAIFYSEWLVLPKGVWADNRANQVHILWQDPDGLHGLFWCTPSVGCITKLCTKHGGIFDARSVKVRW
jgi:hypothetical protein